MKKFLIFSVAYMKYFLLSSIFTTLIVFVGLQIYMYAVPEGNLTVLDAFVFTFFVFISSLGTSLYFGYLSGVDSQKFYRALLKFTSGLRRGKYAERLDVEGTKEISIIAKELNNLAETIEEQAQVMQRLANEKTELHQQVHAAAVMEERQRLARELHDSVSQQLFAMSMMASATVRMLKTNPAALKSQLEQLAEISSKAQGEMRALLLHLRPIELNGESLSEAVISLLKELRDKTNLTFSASVDEIQGLPIAVEEHLFRIVQESLSNILRHAGASKIELVLSEKDDYVYLFIADNGKGFNTEETKKVSYGLKNMRERTEEIGGIFTLRSHPGKGTYIEIRVPIKRK